MNDNAVEVLLVEDTEADAELAIRALRKHGLANRLVWVKDGAEALDFLFAQGEHGEDFENSPKMVLLDLRMPKVNGIEVLRRMKGDVRTQNIPVVMLTSSDESRDLKESYKLGVNSYISKPVNFDEFAKVVGDLGLYWLLVNKLPQA